MKLAILIAAYNEERTIGSTIESVRDFAEVLVVNDGSKDLTSKLARECGAVVFDKQNGGYDSALEFGFQKAGQLGYTHIITFDADGQHPSESIPDYISKFNDGFELVVGVRPKKQRFAESLFAVYTKLWFSIDDPLCGMKGYELSLFREIGHFDSYRSTGTELMLRYLKGGKKSCQLPIRIKDRLDAPRFGRVFRANLYIIKSLLNGILKI